VLDQIRAHAASAYPSEAVGVLGGCGTRIVAAAAVANQSRRPAGRAIVSAADLESALDRLTQAGWEHVGVYHSHPDGIALLSLSDLRAVRTDSIELVASVTSSGVRRVTAWHVQPGEPARALEIEAEPASA
jgi:proteasome lid subunit RPN8/RPN11